MPNITSCPSSPISALPILGENKKYRSIGDLPPEIMAMVCEEINKNEKADDFELSHSRDLCNLGLAFTPEFLINPKSKDDTSILVHLYNNIIHICTIFLNKKNLSSLMDKKYTKNSCAPSQTYNILINKKYIPTELQDTVLDFFIEKKKLSMNEAALSMPADFETRKDKEEQIVARICRSIPHLKGMQFNKLKENLETFPLDNKVLGEILCENLSNIPAHLQGYFLKEGNRLIGHTEGNALLDASPETYGASELKRIMSALHADYLGIFISGLIKKQPTVLSSPEYFQALTNRLGEVSDTDLPLIFELMDRSQEQMRFEGEDCSHIFNMLAQKIDNFPKSKRGLLLIGLASIIQHVRWGRPEKTQWLVAQIDVLIDDASAMSIRIQCLTKLTSHCHSVLEGNEENTIFLEIIKRNLLNIPNSQVGGILGGLAQNMNGLVSEDLQLQILNLLESYLPYPNIRLILKDLTHATNLELEDLQVRALNLPESYLPDDPKSPVRLILADLAHATNLELENLQVRALNLLESCWPDIPDSQIRLILEGLAQSNYSKSEALELRAFNLIKSYIPSDKIGGILYELALNTRYLKSEALKWDAFNLIKSNLANISNNKITPILAGLAKGMGLLRPEALQSQFWNFLESKLPTIAHSQIGEILEGVASSVKYLQSETIQLSAFNFLEENLKQAFENQVKLNLLTEKQLSEILGSLVHIFNTCTSTSSRVFEQRRSNIFSLLEKGMPYLSNKNLSSVLASFFWPEILLIKEEELSRVFSLTENHIDRLPASESERVLIQAARSLTFRRAEVPPKIKYHFFALLQKRLNSVSGDSLLDLLGALTESLQHLDDETQIRAGKLLIKYPADITDPNILNRNGYFDYKTAVNSYSLPTPPSKFRKVAEFFLSLFNLER